METRRAGARRRAGAERRGDDSSPLQALCGDLLRRHGGGAGAHRRAVEPRRGLLERVLAVAPFSGGHELVRRDRDRRAVGGPQQLLGDPGACGHALRADVAADAQKARASEPCLGRGRGADRRARRAALLKTVPEQAVRPKRRP